MVPTSRKRACSARSPGLLGSLMALEAIREIVGGFGGGDESLVGRLLMVDLKGMRFETLRYGWDETNPLSGAAANRLSDPLGASLAPDKAGQLPP